MQRLLKTFGFCLVTIAAALPSPSRAQIDPRMPLSQLIAAFQNCGPAYVYQMLSPQLFAIVAQQTGASGCYAQIAAAGPVLNMVVIDQRMFPVGPMFVIRVSHGGATVDWFMGINRLTNKIEYLNFQNATSAPNLDQGPRPDAQLPTPPPPPNPSPTPRSSGDGCDLYPAMC